MVARLSCIAILMIALGANAVEISVAVQPMEPVANESFRLIFSANEAVNADPDFDVLGSVVDILRRNHQTSIQWINGKNTRTTTWVLDVITKQAGELIIPAVAFGTDRSPATEVAVLPRAGANTSAKSDVGLLLEIEVDKQSPYVQEQTILTARLLRRVELNEANLTDPKIESDAIIKRLGKDRTYQDTRDGKRYEVFERRYSIFPQSSGPLIVQPLTLTTQIVQSSRSRFDPFRQAVTTRRIESNEIVLDVRPVPSSYTGDVWLPARRLRLREDWAPNAEQITAGEPLTRTVFLWADGLNAGQLPEVAITLPDGLKSYPDQPQTSEQETEDGFNAIRQQKYAIIASDEGNLVFPETTVTWWNTETDRQEVARLSERGLTITRASGATNTVEPTTPAPSPDVIAQSERPATAVSTPVADKRIVALVIIGFLGWLATAIAWWLRSRRRRGPKQADLAPPSLRRARRDVAGACKANDPSAAKRALIAWARVASDDAAISTLAKVAGLVDSELSAEIRRLEECLYGQRAGIWDSGALRAAFDAAEIKPKRGSELKQSVTPLPELYHLSDQ